MTCCGKAKNIIKGHYRNITGKKFEFTDGRIRICRGCEKNYWGPGKTLWCSICKCYIPAKARIKEEQCPLNKWKR